MVQCRVGAGVPSGHAETMSITLRPADTATIDAVASIWYFGWREAHLGNVPDELRSARSEESFWRRAADRIVDTTVAVVDDVIAGFIMTTGDEVEQVYVSPDHRGSGVAGVLLAAAERQIAGRGHPHAWLAVVAANIRARRFYERSGWTDAGAFDYLASTDAGPIAVPCHRYVKRLEGLHPQEEGVVGR